MNDVHVPLRYVYCTSSGTQAHVTWAFHLGFRLFAPYTICVAYRTRTYVLSSQIDIYYIPGISPDSQRDPRGQTIVVAHVRVRVRRARAERVPHGTGI